MTHVILLAAGQSQRFGAPKLMQPLPNGVWVGVQTARVYVSLGLPVIAIVRAEQVQLHEQLKALGVELVLHPNPNAGMGTSIALGVQSSAKASSWLIALADMPFIQPATIQAIVQPLEQGVSLIAPFYQDQRGHPVGFSHKHYAALSSLAGDQGAASILKAHTQDLVKLAVSDAGVVQDVDYPSDLSRV